MNQLLVHWVNALAAGHYTLWMDGVMSLAARALHDIMYRVRPCYDSTE
jgi:hypothetical protein